MGTDKTFYDDRPAESIDDLRPRHREVLEQVAHGRSNREIAANLDIKPKTVSSYVSAVYHGLRIDSDPNESSTRVKAALWYWRQWTPEDTR